VSDGGDAALATSGRLAVGGARGGSVRGCCWRRKPKKEAMTEEDDWRSHACASTRSVAA
jgi:hypothetical protein